MKNKKAIKLRMENEKDFEEVENLTREAFWNVYRPGCDEHLVLHNMRKVKAFIKELDYVAEEGNKIVGNIVYTRMFRGQKMSQEMIAFGPLSVHPDYQKQGIGKELVQATLEKAAKLGYKAVLITGNPAYYHQFGFRAAASYGIYLPGMKQDEESDYFMACELEPGYLGRHPGVVDFDKCFFTDKGELEKFEERFPKKKKREMSESDVI